MKKFALLFMICIFVFPQVKAQEEDKKVDYSVCVDFKGWSPLNAFQSSLVFYNQCYMPVYISACVKERFGEWKLYKSFARVGPYGWWKLNIDSSSQPSEVLYSYDHFSPPVPEPCRMDKE